MKKILLASSLLIATGLPAAAQKTTLKFAIFLPAKERTVNVVMRPFAERVVADSKGTLDIKLFPNGALGRNPGRQIKMVQDGVADIAFVVPAYTPGRFPDDSIFGLPNVIQNSTEGSLALWRLLQKGMLRGYDRFLVIGVWNSSPYTIHMKNKITSIDQIKGQKIRAVGPSMIASIQALGGAPEAMPFPRIVEALSRGVIDGTTGFPSVLRDFGVDQIARHHYLGKLGVLPAGILMNRRKFDALPAAAKAAIEKHRGEPVARAYGKMNDARTKSILQAWSKDPQHTVVEPSPADAKKWATIMQAVVDDWVKKHPKGRELMNALKTELATIRAER